MNQNDSTDDTPVKQEGIIVPFIKELKTRLPKSEIEQHLWVTKSGLFVRSEYQATIVQKFRDYYIEKIGTEISEDKAYKKLFNDFSSDRFFLLIGHSTIIGSVITCETNELRGAGIRLYEGIPLDGANAIHQSDPVFSASADLKAKLSRSGYVVEVVTKAQQFEIPFDQIPVLRDFFRSTRDLSRYLQLSTLRAFIQSFAESLKRAKPYSVSFFTILPQAVLLMKNCQWLRIGDTLVVEQDGRILQLVPLKGRVHEEMIRDELGLLAEKVGRRRLAGAALSLRKGSFFADYDIQGISHHFGISAIFNFLDGIIDYHRCFGSFPGKLGKKTSVEEVIKCFTWILRDAHPVMFDKLPASIKEALTPEISSCICTAGEWFFAVDKSKMIRQVWFKPKEEKKVIVPIKMPMEMTTEPDQEESSKV